MPTLFDPITVGDLRLPNRVIMAPLTRDRSNGIGRAPNVVMRDYYTQRASAGAIISEATSARGWRGGRCCFRQAFHRQSGSAA